MRGALPVARRILLELRQDRRTLGLVLVVPAFLIYLLSEVFRRPQPYAPVLLGVFVFVLTYVLTAIGFLRERQSGTLERVRATPISGRGLVGGYLLGFGVLATAQSLVLLGAGIYFLDVSFEHGVAPFVLLELLGALTALGIGVLLSLFAHDEFQVMQFTPTVIVPQIVLGGTFLPVEALPWYLEYPARAMPVTYLIRGMEYVVLDAGERADLWIALAALAAFTLLTLALAAAAVRRAA